MRLSAKTIGDIRRNLRKETEFISRMATKATKEATNGLKAGLRNDIVSAGFGVRLSRTWRSKIYDDNGVDVKGFVYSRAPEIIESFDQGVVMRPSRRRLSSSVKPLIIYSRRRPVAHCRNCVPRWDFTR